MAVQKSKVSKAKKGKRGYVHKNKTIKMSNKTDLLTTELHIRHLSTESKYYRGF